MACYLSTIRKADAFVEKVYQELTNQETKLGRLFSIIYFGDYGMVHREFDKGRIVLNNNMPSRFHYDVPLIKCDSGDERPALAGRDSR